MANSKLIYNLHLSIIYNCGLCSMTCKPLLRSILRHSLQKKIENLCHKKFAIIKLKEHVSPSTFKLIVGHVCCVNIRAFHQQK